MSLRNQNTNPVERALTGSSPGADGSGLSEGFRERLGAEIGRRPPGAEQVVSTGSGALVGVSAFAAVAIGASVWWAVAAGGPQAGQTGNGGEIARETGSFESGLEGLSLPAGLVPILEDRLGLAEEGRRMIADAQLIGRLVSSSVPLLPGREVLEGEISDQEPAVPAG